MAVTESFCSGDGALTERNDIEALQQALARFEKVVSTGLSHRRSLRLWSEFVRMRDGARCVLCGDVEGISAHHICRKSFMVVAQFETGNGISLCRSCHREVHSGFNGRPDFALPMDAQGGEKINIMEDLYGRLLDDADRQGLLCNEFYFL